MLHSQSSVIIHSHGKKHDGYQGVHLNCFSNPLPSATKITHFHRDLRKEWTLFNLHYHQRCSGELRLVTGKNHGDGETHFYAPRQETHSTIGFQRTYLLEVAKVLLQAPWECNHQRATCRRLQNDASIVFELIQISEICQIFDIQTA